MPKEMIKQDINLLEYPLWFQDECEAERSEGGFIWRHSKGFVLKTSFKPPVKTDLIFLLYLLLESQNQSWKDEIRLSRYQILKKCGLSRNTQWYDRLEESLERWKQVGLEFNGAFYNGKEYETLHFGVIDSWGIDKVTKKLRIRFSPEYLSLVQNTPYCRYLNFDQLKALRSPLATRLYQLLIKTFKNRDIWEIDATLLAEKIPMKKIYPAHIALKIKPAVRRIYNYTDLKVTVEERKKGRGEIVFVFRKEPSQPTQTPFVQKAKPFVIPENDAFKKLILLLPPERQNQKSLLELVWKEFNKKGFDFVVWNIKYANQKAIGNYPAYLLKSLRRNFGEVLREDGEIAQLLLSKRFEEAEARKIKMTEAQTKETQESIIVEEYLKTLSHEERLEIDMKAFGKLPGFIKTKNSFEEIRKMNQASFAGLVRFCALEKFKAKTAPQQPEIPDIME